MTHSEISELFIECAKSVRQDVSSSQGQRHLTDWNKRDILYNFITNKKVLNLIHNVLLKEQKDKHEVIRSLMTSVSLVSGQRGQQNRESLRSSVMNKRSNFSKDVDILKTTQDFLSKTNTINFEDAKSVGNIENFEDLQTLNNLNDSREI